MRWRSRRALLASFFLIAASGAALFSFFQSRPAVTTALVVAPTAIATPATFVDESSCAACHAAQAQAWQGSHHDLAMQEATAATVLGNFSDASFVKDGIRTRFFQRDGKYWINTDADDGQPADFEVKYTFGVEPLQQYLIQLDRGRLQAFTIAWDVARRRWFHLYPRERIDHRDPLHWTQPSQNWNFMCAECHSTGLEKNFNVETRSYDTAWQKIDVGCQACHGPASRHVLNTQAPGKADFATDFAAADATMQIETCARCHSRRSVISDQYRHGEALMQTHLPSLLTADLYYADGQMLGEVYEYGSFLQSRMHAQGVRCSDCHEPHSLQLRREGNELCTGCHNANAPAARAGIDTSGLQRKDYDSPAHHFHQPDKPGSQCVDCHAPARLYMQIDARRDHSFRIPRPDLSVQIGTPNACNGCHERRTPEWAATQVAKWVGPDRRQAAMFAGALDAARKGDPTALSSLISLAGDTREPAIVRASALDLLRSYPGQPAFEALQIASKDQDPMVRATAADGFGVYAPTHRAALLPLINDPVRAVRLSAIAAATPESLHAKAIGDYEQSQRANADQPGAHTNLGNLHASLGRAEQAEADYQTAIRLDPTFVPAYVNLADLKSRAGLNGAAVSILQVAIEAQPGSGSDQTAALHHALGLALIREKRPDEALRELQLATQQSPDDARYAYVLGVALHDTGSREQGVSVLERTLQQRPADRDVLTALAAYAAEAGDDAAALRYRERLDAN